MNHTAQNDELALNVAERLRTPKEVCEPDPRQEAFVRLDESGVRARTLHDHYSAVAESALRESVPLDVRVHFETSRNLLLYSWFVYRFIAVAELHAYSSIEFALRKKYGKKRESLKKLLQRAVADGLIRDDGFQVHQRAVRNDEAYRALMADIPGYALPEPEQKDIQEYCKTLVEALPYLRNKLAHGSPMIHPGGYATLEISADLINQLF